MKKSIYMLVVFTLASSVRKAGSRGRVSCSTDMNVIAVVFPFLTFFFQDKNSDLLSCTHGPARTEQGLSSLLKDRELAVCSRSQTQRLWGPPVHSRPM